MGFVYHELIPAAILLDNPGLTKEEFSELLGKTDYYPGEIKPSEKVSWDFVGEDISEQPWNKLHSGIWGVAQILGLDKSEEFRKLKSSYRLEDRVLKNLNPYCGIPYLEILTSKERGSWSRRFVVEKFLEGKISERSVFGRFGGLGDTPYEVNDPVMIDSFVSPWKARDFAYGIVEKYVTYDKKKREHVMRVREVAVFSETETFDNEENLLEKYPLFDPEVMYDFSKKKGRLNLGIFCDNFLWKKEDERYYLDPKTFSLIEPSFFSGSDMGYHDLILTAEAIKNNAWKLLSYKGLQHKDDFLRDFPASKERYERAVRDSYTSLCAKKERMTNSDFLRMRVHLSAGIEK